MTPNNIAILGLATELSATLEEITDLRSQYGRPSRDEPRLLIRCRALAVEIQAGLLVGKVSPTWEGPQGGDAA